MWKLSKSKSLKMFVQIILATQSHRGGESDQRGRGVAAEGFSRRRQGDLRKANPPDMHLLSAPER